MFLIKSYRNNEFISLQKTELKQLAMQPVIGAIAARLARTSEIRIFDEQLCRKLPNGNPDFSDPEVFPVVWAES